MSAFGASAEVTIPGPQHKFVQVKVKSDHPTAGEGA